jgi:hypothetical protein
MYINRQKKMIFANEGVYERNVEYKKEKIFWGKQTN